MEERMTLDLILDQKINHSQYRGWTPRGILMNRQTYWAFIYDIRTRMPLSVAHSKVAKYRDLPIYVRETGPAMYLLYGPEDKYP
jgi:hypothetical protein